MTQYHCIDCDFFSLPTGESEGTCGRSGDKEKSTSDACELFAGSQSAPLGGPSPAPNDDAAQLLLF